MRAALLAHGAGHATEGGDGLLLTGALVITMVVIGVLSLVRSRRRQKDDVP